MEQTAERWPEGFGLGQEDWAEAARIALGCAVFSPDVEEEQVADAPRSCYNCRRRRWTAASFRCLAGESPPHPARGHRG